MTAYIVLSAEPFWFLLINVYCFRFAPPDNFNLAMVTLDLDFIKKGGKSEQVTLFEYLLKVLLFFSLLFSYC